MYPCLQQCSGILQHNVQGNHAWLDAPVKELRALVDHNWTQKATAPYFRSACIMVPKILGSNLHLGMKHMRLMAEFRRGHHLLQVPNGKRLAGLPLPLQVWYDSSTVQLSAATARPYQLAMHWKCKVSGCRAQILLDTGADGAQPYICKSFSKQNKIVIKAPADLHVATSVDGSSVKVHALSSVYLHTQKYG